MILAGLLSPRKFQWIIACSCTFLATIQHIQVQYDLFRVQEGSPYIGWLKQRFQRSFLSCSLFLSSFLGHVRCLRPHSGLQVTSRGRDHRVASPCCLTSLANELLPSMDFITATVTTPKHTLRRVPLSSLLHALPFPCPCPTPNSLFYLQNGHR